MRIYSYIVLLAALIYPLASHAQQTVAVGTPINAPNGVAGLDAAGFIHAPMKGAIDNATVGGTALVNLIPGLTSQSRGTSGLTLSQLSTPGTLNITATLQNAGAQSAQAYLITDNGSTDTTTTNAKNAVNLTLQKTLWNTRDQTTVPIGIMDAFSSSVYNGGYGTKNSDGTYTGDDGSAYSAVVNFSGYGKNAALKATTQYTCSDSVSDNNLQPAECTAAGVIPYALTMQMAGIVMPGSAVSGHKATVVHATATAGTWEGMVLTQSGTSFYDRLLSYVDQNSIEQASWTATGILSTADLEIRTLSTTTGPNGVISTTQSGCVSIGKDPNGRIAIGCGTTGSVPYLDLLGQGYGTAVRFNEPVSGQFQLQTKGSANNVLNDVFDCNATPSCWFNVPVTINASIKVTNGLTVAKGAAVTGGLTADALTVGQVSLTPTSFATLGSATTVGVQKYCSDCFSYLRSSSYTHTGLVVTSNGSDWVDGIGNPVTH